MKSVQKIWADLSAKEVELSEEKKVELAIGADLAKISLATAEANSKLNDVLDDLYVPLRRVEKAVTELRSGDEAMPFFKEFMTKLEKLEVEYDEGIKKIRQAENDLGVSIDTPPQFADALSSLKFLQKKEQDYRGEIKELNALVKKYK
jgi:hypothetical protein